MNEFPLVAVINAGGRSRRIIAQCFGNVDVPEREVLLGVARGTVDVPVHEPRAASSHRDHEEHLASRRTVDGRATPTPVHHELDPVGGRAVGDEVDGGGMVAQLGAGELAPRQWCQRTSLFLVDVV